MLGKTHATDCPPRRDGRREFDETRYCRVAVASICDTITEYRRLSARIQAELPPESAVCVVDCALLRHARLPRLSRRPSRSRRTPARLADCTNLPRPAVPAPRACTIRSRNSQNMAEIEPSRTHEPTPSPDCLRLSPRKAPAAVQAVETVRLPYLRLSTCLPLSIDHGTAARPRKKPDCPLCHGGLDSRVTTATSST